ncbi:MAG: methylthioribulose 1-phosphate dehydratase, partial [Chloroflexi bacterium]
MTMVRQDRPLTDSTTRELLSSLLRDWHGRGWVSGTGGGICGPTEDGNLFLAPTGVHKELVRPDDFFVVSPADGRVVQEPKTPGLRPSECNSIFGL